MRDVFDKVDGLIGSGSIAGYAKTSLDPFVSGVPLCTAFIVFRHLRHLADVWLELTIFAEALQHSHGTRVEGWKRIGQFSAPGFCNYNGRELYHYNGSWHRHGVQIWPEPQGNVLLPDIGSVYPIGSGFISDVQMDVTACCLVTKGRRVVLRQAQPWDGGIR